MLNNLLQAVLLAACLATFGTETLMAAEQTHPRLYLIPQDIERGKRNIARYAWAGETFQQLKNEAEKWVSLPEAFLRSVLPAPREKIACGGSSCPECHSSWP